MATPHLQGRPAHGELLRATPFAAHRAKDLHHSAGHYPPTKMIPRAREAFADLISNREKADNVAATRKAVGDIVGPIRQLPEGGELVAEMTSAGLAGVCQMALVAGGAPNAG
ncbi:hypothetical protein [Thiomonas sp.]|uniref:hypothetical protein n=1 Tax=Thiomonas sp. TaxID=2047785 RepID=UPI002612F838|nr:hypothetical protein [Thiomonas sp.]